MRSTKSNIDMLILLSPAKTMTGTSKIKAPQGTTPRFQQEANEIALHMTQFPIDELSRILKLSPKLAAECYRRYQDFHAEDNQPLQAILAYTGVVFKNISPKDFTEEDFLFLARTYAFRIGMLRVTSPIRPYQALPDGVRRKNPGTRRREYVRLLEGQANKYINP